MLLEASSRQIVWNSKNALRRMLNSPHVKDKYPNGDPVNCHGFGGRACICLPFSAGVLSVGEVAQRLALAEESLKEQKKFDAGLLAGFEAACISHLQLRNGLVKNMSI